jgi:hypothetical protein
VRYASCAPSRMVHQRARGRCCCSRHGGVDELGDAVDPVIEARLRWAVAQQLVRHEQSSTRVRSGSALRGSAWVPGRVQGGSLLLDVVVLWVLDAGLGVGGGPWSGVGARTTARAVRDRLGVDPARGPAREALSSSLGHGEGEVEDAPQPPTWRAKCRRVVPGTRGMSHVCQESSKGLNTSQTTLSCLGDGARRAR